MHLITLPWLAVGSSPYPSPAATRAPGAVAAGNVLPSTPTWKEHGRGDRGAGGSQAGVARGGLPVSTMVEVTQLAVPRSEGRDKRDSPRRRV